MKKKDKNIMNIFNDLKISNPKESILSIFVAFVLLVYFSSVYIKFLLEDIVNKGENNDK